ncbi:hypothetical protein EV138_5415 [Kribbella voronezhensis]|uniref:Fibronectin type-III domain-containing protein n=1 Tax=Kribbella voronezhensis TaxID=2512212 RepID=A0A4R7THI7_9ACTN|nr:Ig-like domain-containing protein [Kribbella voronezhensis]TDU91802.1 hypothetical protein EV138_5415 [Kribbella voronezhensis]
MIRRRLLLLLATTVALLTAAGVALAFWTTSGTGAGSAMTGTLAPPTNVTAVATPGSGTVPVSWSASSQATGYYVLRIRNSDSSSTAACGTSAAQPTTAISCDDLAVADGIYHYVVIAVRGSWTATSASSNDVTVNNTRPAVTVNQAAGQTDPTKTAPINFTAVFTTPVTDFTSADVTLTAGTATVTGSGTTYNIAVSGLTSSGSVTASIAANTVHDAAGAGNTASTSTDNTVTYDVTPPTAPAPGATATTVFGTNPLYVNNEPVILTDAATDAHSAVASVTYYYCPGSTGTCTTGTSIGTSTTAAGNFAFNTNAPLVGTDGPYRVVAVATDTAGNTSAPSAATPISVDTTPPTVTRPTVNGHS